MAAHLKQKKTCEKAAVETVIEIIQITDTCHLRMTYVQDDAKTTLAQLSQIYFPYNTYFPRHCNIHFNGCFLGKPELAGNSTGSLPPPVSKDNCWRRLAQLFLQNRCHFCHPTNGVKALLPLTALYCTDMYCQAIHYR